MGFTIVVETEEGERLETVDDPTNALSVFVNRAVGTWHQCLDKIDLYGDTEFNHLEVPQLILELDALQVDVGDAEATRVISGIRKLAERVGADRHVYLMFYGD